MARVLISELIGGSKPEPYDGAGACYVELGGELVARIDVNFLTYDTPVAKPNGPTAQFVENGAGGPRGRLGGSGTAVATWASREPPHAAQARRGVNRIRRQPV